MVNNHSILPTDKMVLCSCHGSQCVHTMPVHPAPSVVTIIRAFFARSHRNCCNDGKIVSQSTATMWQGNYNRAGCCQKVGWKRKILFLRLSCRYAALDDTPPQKGLDLVFMTGHNLARIRYTYLIASEFLKNLWNWTLFANFTPFWCIKQERTENKKPRRQTHVRI